MERNQLERLGGELREVGHKRRKLAEQIFQEVQEGDNRSTKELYKELSVISDKAISIISKQKELFDQELQKM